MLAEARLESRKLMEDEIVKAKMHLEYMEMERRLAEIEGNKSLTPYRKSVMKKQIQEQTENVMDAFQNLYPDLYKDMLKERAMAGGDKKPEMEPGEKTEFDKLVDKYNEKPWAMNEEDREKAHKIKYIRTYLDQLEQAEKDYAYYRWGDGSMESGIEARKRKRKATRDLGNARMHLKTMKAKDPFLYAQVEEERTRKKEAEENAKRRPVAEAAMPGKSEGSSQQGGQDGQKPQNQSSQAGTDSSDSNSKPMSEEEKRKKAEKDAKVNARLAEFRKQRATLTTASGRTTDYAGLPDWIGRAGAGSKHYRDSVQAATSGPGRPSDYTIGRPSKSGLGRPVDDTIGRPGGGRRRRRGYSQGGEVHGEHFSGDRDVINVNSGEYVLTRGQMDNLSDLLGMDSRDDVFQAASTDSSTGPEPVKMNASGHASFGQDTYGAAFGASDPARPSSPIGEASGPSQSAYAAADSASIASSWAGGHGGGHATGGSQTVNVAGNGEITVRFDSKMFEDTVARIAYKTVESNAGALTAAGLDSQSMQSSVI